MGVRIETLMPHTLNELITVTPCMGVWIETGGLNPVSTASSVTPCMGVWIETYRQRIPSV